MYAQFEAFLGAICRIRQPPSEMRIDILINTSTFTVSGKNNSYQKKLQQRWKKR